MITSRLDAICELWCYHDGIWPTHDDGESINTTERALGWRTARQGGELHTEWQNVSHSWARCTLTSIYTTDNPCNMKWMMIVSDSVFIHKLRMHCLSQVKLLCTMTKLWCVRFVPTIVLRFSANEVRCRVQIDFGLNLSEDWRGQSNLSCLWLAPPRAALIAINRILSGIYFARDLLVLCSSSSRCSTCAVRRAPCALQRAPCALQRERSQTALRSPRLSDFRGTSAWVGAKWTG